MLGAYSYPRRFASESVMANQLATELEKLGAVCHTSGSETGSRIRVTVSDKTTTFQVTLNDEGKHSVGQPGWSTVNDWDYGPVYTFLRCQKQREDSFSFLVRCLTDLQKELGLEVPTQEEEEEEN